MEDSYSISLNKLIDEFSLTTLYLPAPAETIMISSNEVDRPGLALAGFFEIFEPSRIQMIGNAEHRYLERQTPEDRTRKIRDFMSAHPAAVIVTAGLPVFDELVDQAKRNCVPVFASKEKTTNIMAAMIASLNVYLAPRITRHGVLVEVYGEGMLILGESGVGKSETAIELVKRGHRLIADDAVEIKRVSSKTLVGTAPEIIRHYVELRGIGIVDVKRIFGVGAVKMTEKIDMVVNLEPWVEGKMYDRLGLENNVTEILGIEIPTTIIPVRPGRNLAIILEIAAMNNRQKRMGYNTAVEFNKRLMGEMNSDAGR